MARKKELTKKQQAMIDTAFSDVDQVTVNTEFGPITLISLDEMPIENMKKFMTSPSEQRVFHMMDFMKMCLINPADWDKLSNLPVKKINSIIQSWMIGSENRKETFEEEEE
jgi:hypothetical protein